MTLDHARPPSQPRWFALSLIVVLHIAGVLLWPQRDGGSRSAVLARETAVTFVSMPVPPPARSVPPVTPVRPRIRKAAPPPAIPALRLIPAPEPVAPVEAEAPVPRSAADITLQAKRDVGKIDRDLRSASLNMAERHLSLTMTQRERAIAAAFGERGPPRVVEEVMSDGRRRSRVGNKCAYKESNGLVGARDVFRDGVKTRWGDC